MGLWERLRRPDRLRKLHATAASLEDEGKLEDAAAAYEKSGEHLHAIRVMLALADQEPDARARVRLLARAARVGLGEVETPRELRVRYAKARLDLAAKSPSSSLLPSELSALGRELVAEGEHGAAAEAFRLAGDARGAADALTEAGEIEQLEGVLESENDRARTARTRAIAVAEIEALEASGQRLAAIDRATSLARSGDDELGRLASRVEAALLRGPLVSVTRDGATERWVLGPETILGRVDCGIVVASPLVSRRHLRFHRDELGRPCVSDLSASNGTFLSGCRLAGTIAVEGAIALSIGREIDVELRPEDGGLRLDVAGATYRVPLGPARIGPWRLVAGARGVRLEVPPGAPPPLLGGTVAAAEGVDLAAGDVLTASRDGAGRLVVAR